MVLLGIFQNLGELLFDLIYFLLSQMLQHVNPAPHVSVKLGRTACRLTLPLLSGVRSVIIAQAWS